MAAEEKVKLLGISGSIRAKSTNTAILETLRERGKDAATLSLISLDDVPLYNADQDGEHCPHSVRSLKQAIADTDALVLCSPEYNHGTSGVLKNALDWASRPAFQSPLKNKPILIMTSSPGAIGGVRAHQQLRDAWHRPSRGSWLARRSSWRMCFRRWRKIASSTNQRYASRSTRLTG